MSALACFDVHKYFGGLRAVNGVSFSVERGEILGVIGPNGSGKTTLFDAASGHTVLDRGRVELDGRDISHLSAYARARLGLGRTFQSPIVPSGLSVAETLLAARSAWHPKVNSQDAEEAVRRVRLDVNRARMSGVLDALDRRKLLLGCLLMREPLVILLDEPCSGLVEDEIAEIDEIIRDIATESRIGVVVVEHRIELLQAIAERVLVLQEGRQIAEGSPAEVFADPNVRTAYFDAPIEAAR